MIPSRLRRRMGIKKGTRIAFEERGVEKDIKIAWLTAAKRDS